MKPALAVLITYHNEGALLKECLESLVRNPDDRPDEVLIHDDASWLPPERFVPEGLPVRIFRAEERQGPSIGRNRLLNQTRCDYVHFHDADDPFLPEWLPRIRAAIAEGADLIVTEMNICWEDRPGVVQQIGLKQMALQDPVKFSIWHGVCTSAGTMRRELAIRAGGFKEQMFIAEDWDFFVRLITLRPKLAVLEQPLVIKRTRLYSLSKAQIPIQASISRLQAIPDLKNRLAPEYWPELGDLAAVRSALLWKNQVRPWANQGFRLAKSLGARFPGRNLYGFLARVFGLEIAERAGMLYRRMIPGRVRQWLI